MAPAPRPGLAALAAGSALGLLALAAAGCLQVGDALADPSDPRVVVTVAGYGPVTLQLFQRHAPVTVANFLNLTRAGYYDGLVFHRVIQGFVVQGGGVWPNGTEKPAPGPAIPLETSPALTHRDGCLGMAREPEPDSARSQFYICDGPQHQLDDARRQAERGERGYAVFGRVEAGLAVVRTIASLQTDSEDRPLRDVVVTRVAEVPR